MESKLNEIKNKKLCEESVEEIHYYYVNMIQEGKIFEKKLVSLNLTTFFFSSIFSSF